MKKPLVLMATLVAAATAWAQLYSGSQPQITYATHGLTPGDVHKTRTVQYCDPQGEGANLVWDYSGVPFANEEVFAETLNAGTDGKNIAAGNSVGTTFSFNVTPQGNEYFGFKHGNYSVEYSQPILKTRFPQTYLDQFSGEFSGQIKCSGTSANISGAYSTTVDAYGTIILPGGKTFANVLRVKTTEANTEGAANTVEIEKYLWYAPVLRYPIFVTHIYKNTYNGNTYEQKSSHVSVAALEYNTPAEKAVTTASAEKFAYDIYPNPVENEALVTYKLAKTAKVSVKVYDANGQCTQVLLDNTKQKEGAYQYTYLPTLPGIYFVILDVDGERISKMVVKN